MITTEPQGVEELVHAARSGDRGAFGELYGRFFRMVHGLLLARLPNSEVDDAAQEVFLQAMRQIGNLREAGSFGGWLAQIARRHSADHFRRRHETAELPDNLAAKPEDGEAWVVLEAIRNLPEAYRETLMLRFVEGLTGPEIAAQTGLTHDSVRVNLHRGVKMLREHFDG